LKNKALAPIVAFSAMFSVSITLIACPIKAVEYGIRLEILGVFPMIGSLLHVLIRPITSAVSDKLGRKIIILISLFMLFLGSLLYALVYHPLLLILSYTISALGFGLIWGPLTALSVESYRRESRGVSLTQSSAFFGNFLGTLSSGFLYQILGLDNTLFFSAAISFFTFWVSLFLTETLHEKVSIRIGFISALRSSLKTFKRVNSLGLRAVMRIYGPPLLIYSGLNPELVGVLMMADPLISGVMQFVSSTLYEKGFYRLGELNILANIFSMLFLMSATMSALATLIFLVAYSVSSSLLITAEQSKLARAELGRASKIAGYDVATALSRTLSSATISATATILSIEISFLITGGVFSFLSLLSILSRSQRYGEDS